MVGTRRLNQLRDRLTDAMDLPEGPLVVALSGGADSASLAYLLTGAGKDVRAVHVNHGTPHAGAMEEAAGDIAGVLGLSIVVTRVEVGDRFSEVAARSARYRALGAERRPGEWVVTAHNRDDQAETILMNLIRGTGLDGLAGIPARVGDFLARPLLAVTRSDLRELAVLAGLPFVDDPSNLDVSFTRNAVRYDLLPHLQSRFNPNLVDSLARTGDVVRQDLDFLDDLVDGADMSAGEGSASMPIGALATMPGPVADRLLRRLLVTVRPPYGPTYDEMTRIRAVVRGESAAAELAGGVRVEIDGAVLRAHVAGPRSSDPQDVVPLDLGVNRLGGWVIEVAESPDPCRVAPLSPYNAIFPVATRLTASVSDDVLTVSAGGDAAWIPGRRRLPVAFYNPGDSGYLSVLAREDSGWT